MTRRRRDVLSPEEEHKGRARDALLATRVLERHSIMPPHGPVGTTFLITGTKVAANYAVVHLDQVTTLGRQSRQYVWSSKPTWRDEVIKRLLHVVSLPPNWDSYGALPISPDVAAVALDLLDSIMDLEGVFDARAPLVVPANHGGIQLEWHSPMADASIEIEIFPSRQLEALYLNGAQRTEWQGTLETFPDWLATISRELAHGGYFGAVVHGFWGK